MNSNFLYIGPTNNNLERRIEEHNRGRSRSTAPYKPYCLEAYRAVKSEQRARSPEKYFKTGSGKAILKKRILTEEAVA